MLKSSCSTVTIMAMEQEGEGLMKRIKVVKVTAVTGVMVRIATVLEH